MAYAARARTDTVPGSWWRRLVDEVAGTARAQLGAARAGAAWTTGSTLTDADAIAYALHDEWPGARDDPGGAALSSREHQVVELVSQGLTNRQIAARMGISTRTAASHLESIRRKLDLPTRAHLTIWAGRRAP